MEVPIPILAAYGAASVLALAAFAWDKAAAGRGARRIPERNLHLLELLGGWPGALLGAILFRHKTRKGSYLAVTALVIAVHAAGWWWYLRSR